MSHMDFVDAEITSIEARDENDEEIAIDNLGDVEYYN